MGIVVWGQSPAKNRAQPRKEMKSRCTDEQDVLRLPPQLTVGRAMMPISFVFLFIGIFWYIHAQHNFNDDATSSPYARSLHKQSLIFLVVSGFFLLVHLLVFTITFAPLLHRLILTSRASLSSPRVLSISFNQLSNINAVSFGYSWYLGWLTFGLIPVLTSVMANGIFYKKIFEDTPVPKPKAVVGTVLLKRN